MVLVKNWHCFYICIFFFYKIGQENVFHDILGTKNAFLHYKNNKLKKVEHMSVFFILGNIDQENVFYNIVERNTPF